MKKVLYAVLLMSGMANATPNLEEMQKKVVELHITHIKEETPVKGNKKGRYMRLPGQGVCSGFFIDSLGDIVTAGHCTEKAESIEVQIYDGKLYTARIVGISTIHDLALLHIDAVNTDFFKAANTVIQGESVWILGSPLAVTGTLSTGIIAKLGGDLTILDCSVLPGNSGSAVVNYKGEVVGVATAVATVGFGVTHMSIMESLDALRFFVVEQFSKR